MATSGSFNTNAGYAERYLHFAWQRTSYSIANNTSTIQWTLTGAGGAHYYTSRKFKVIINGTQVYYSASDLHLYNGTEVASGTVVIQHDADGTKTFSASAECAMYYYSVNATGSGTWTLDAIPRQATITNAPNFTDEQNPKITYSNPALENVSTLQAAILSSDENTAYAAYRNISKTGTSYTFSLTTAERNALRSASANSKTLSVKFAIKTVIAGNTFYTYADKTLTIVNASPVLGSFGYADTNATTLAITGDDQVIIQKNSTLVFTAGTATAQKGASIASYSIAFNGQTYTGQTVTITAPNISTDLAAVLTVTDSRGYTTSQSITVTVWAWSLPYALITAERQSNFYSETDILVDATYSSLDGNNAVVIKYRYKKVSDSTWSSYVTIQNRTTATATLDNTYQWNLQVVITDLLGSVTYNLTIDRGMPLIYFDTDKYSVGINKFPVSKSLEVDGDADIDGNLDISGSLGIGSNLSVTGNSGIGGTLNVTGNTQINGTMQVNDVLTINGDVYINSKLLKVWITETGTEDGWTYKKFSDKTFEAWTNRNFTITSSTSGGNIWYSNVITVDFPFRINDAAVSGTFNTEVCWLANVSLGTDTLSFRIGKGLGALNTSTNYKAKIIVIGTYV